MQTFEQALIDAGASHGEVEREVAADAATNRHDFLVALERELKRRAVDAATSRVRGRRSPMSPLRAGLRLAAPSLVVKVLAGLADKRIVNAALAAVVFAPGLAVGSFLNVVAVATAARPVGRRRRARPACTATPRSGRATTSRSSRTCSCAAAAVRARRRSACATRRSSSARRSSPRCVVAFGLLDSAALAAAIFCAALVAVSATDIEQRIVPNRVVLPRGRRARAPAGVAPEPRVARGRARRRALPLRRSRSPIPRGMGMGDVKLALLLGVGVGRSVPVALLRRACCRRSSPPSVLFARHGAAARKMAIPFAPFLALGRRRRAVRGQRG